MLCSHMSRHIMSFASPYALYELVAWKPKRGRKMKISVNYAQGKIKFQWANFQC